MRPLQRRISYLTIEHHGPIPEGLRLLMGNRIYGCDDCQLICPWNKFARPSALADFEARSPWAGVGLRELWQWDEAQFLQRTEGSPIRRIGFQRWRRNLAVALGNACAAGVDVVAIRAELQAAYAAADELVREHIAWAIAQGPA